MTEAPYPALSIKRGEEGSVSLPLTIGESGRVTDAAAAETSGYPLLDRAAIDEALSSWRFILATRNGKPIVAKYKMEISFRLASVYR